MFSYAYLFLFHRARRIRNKVPLTHNSVAMAIHAPLSPNMLPRKYASGILTAHTLRRFSTLDKRVSPAPLKTPAATIDAPYKGSAKASILRIRVPSIRIS